MATRILTDEELDAHALSAGRGIPDMEDRLLNTALHYRALARKMARVVDAARNICRSHIDCLCDDCEAVRCLQNELAAQACATRSPTMADPTTWDEAVRMLIARVRRDDYYADTDAIALADALEALLDSPILRAVGHPRFVSVTQQSTEPGKQEWAVIILPAHEARYEAQFADTAEAACAAALESIQ